MEGYAYSYPDSGESSPRSHRTEIDFESNPPWDSSDPQHHSLPPHTSNYKVKFMVSYGGKIHPRPHDHLLSYVGGDTKILSVDRSLSFSSLLSKLSSLLPSDPDSPLSLSSFKYQLPGEDLDALITVTNDDDLDHLMLEYDRLLSLTRSSSSNSSSKSHHQPPRLRLFLFPTQSTGFGSGSSEPGKLDRDRFVDALNSAPAPVPAPSPPPPNTNNNGNVDFLFGLEKGLPVQVPVQVVGKGNDPIYEPDPQIEARIHELNRVQISPQPEHHQQQPPQQQHNLLGGYAGDSYQNPPTAIPANIPAGYWQTPSPATMGLEQQHHHHQQQQQAPPQQQQQQQQPVYMVHAPPPQASMYHAPPPVAMRQVTGPPSQGYYQMQPQPVYNMAPPPQPQPPPPTVPAPAKMGGYSEGGMGVPVRQVAGLPEGYAQMAAAYDSATGRPVYYAAPGGGVNVTAPFQGGGSDGRPLPAGGLTNVEGKVVVQKVSPTSAAV